jgi:hypothetical protein
MGFNSILKGKWKKLNFLGLGFEFNDTDNNLIDDHGVAYLF